VRPGLTGWLEYTRIGRDRIDIAWHVPGSTRRVHGRSSPAAWERSRTTGFQHTGPLASALRHAYREVAALRLQRLAHAIDHAG
jgi:hypothetical protein